MKTIKFYLLVVLLLVSSAANAEDKTLTIYVIGCSDEDQSADVIYAADQNYDSLKKMNVNIVVDEKKKRCGYGLKKGKQKKYLKSGLTDLELYDELFAFFEKNEAQIDGGRLDRSR